MMMANPKLHKQALLPPRSPFPTAAAPSPYADRGPIARPQVGAAHHRHGHHQRTSSESFIEEQPPLWLDDLLNEPETPAARQSGGRAGHRRSSSDSFALFDGGAAGAAGAYANGFEGMGRGGGQPAPWGGVQEYYAKPASFGRAHGRPWEQGMPNSAGFRHGGGLPMPMKDKVGGHHGPPNVPREHDHGMDKRTPDDAGHDQKVGAKEGVLPKHAQSEADNKRAKQQYAQRSRVRKLQYIAELEGRVQALQSEGVEVSAEMEFLTQQNIMLDLENKALKQRLESLAQEQLIKRFQQEMFEREIGRLRSLYQQQQQQQQQQVPALVRSNSRDLDVQFANLSLKHKDPNSGRDALSGPLRT
ncbi:uncharacterized protein At4g06598-like [Sorghum bicolor]|uniref:BZIP domain-containing protein n=1 Tax=Sorghum bicolor TaxID=4558 RepID=A0A1B6PRF3_SORBI|nr:uncharacterized protein At4g06598-like [Sorghum bicolor]XP_021317004.1 uncharacterized protein At4g06598-like [Sorghum bicolor]KXG28232.1 hypothetical protein SORBI_3005G100600 [Sorghum bicolor]KXG28233.1 hypothetical protein SORBI_3005G100600 [Sorghum bicolor]|eukprot:XP_021317003.1 uncharacterized protein At4g06598-like [Sorghum bicolor]